MAIYRPYGKLIERVNKNSTGSKFGLMDRTLEIFETKRGLKGILYISNEIGWRNKQHILFVCHFTEKTEGEQPSVQRVKEYFNF
jgi:hypothetical protein